MPGHSRAITSTTPRRALMFGSALWLAKQMNLVEFVEAACGLLGESRTICMPRIFAQRAF